MSIIESRHRFIADELADTTRRLVDFAVLVHPLPWEPGLEEQVQATVMEVFEFTLAAHDDVRRVVDVDRLRETTLAALHERLAFLAIGPAATGSA